MSAVFMFLCRQQKNNRQLITGCVLLIFKRLQAVNFLRTVQTLLTRQKTLGKKPKQWNDKGRNHGGVRPGAEEGRERQELHNESKAMLASIS